MAAAARSQAHVSVSLISFDAFYKRLGEVTEIPEIAPKSRERDPDEQVLVVFDDGLKRLLTLVYNLDHEMSEKTKRLDRLTKTITDTIKLGNIAGGSRSSMFDAVFGENTERDALREQVRSLEAELRLVAPVLQLAHAAYQAELLERFSDLAKQEKVVVCSDWTIVAATEDDLRPAGGIGDMLKDLFGEGDDEAGGGMSLGDLLGRGFGSHREPGMGRHRHAREHERA